MTGNEELKTVAFFALLPQKTQSGSAATLPRMRGIAGIRQITEGKVSVGQR